MTMDVVYIVVSLLLLFGGAEALVRGSASLALRAGLSPLVVGLTVVAFGTSSPELVVSIKAALAQQGDISIGNVVGSNSFNIGIILGLTALICPIPVRHQIVRIDAPIALGVALLLPLLLLDHGLGRFEGALLFAGIIAYTWMSFILGKKAGDAPQDDVAVPAASRHWGIDVAYLVGGLGVLVFGSNLLVDHAVALAQGLGVSEAVIGLTIVAAGTSMPELATSVIAALRKQPDIAIGNIIGSNIFNILAILGVASIVTPLEAFGITWTDFVAMIIFSVLLIPLLYTGRVLHRLEGLLLLALYGIYLYMLWPAG